MDIVSAISSPAHPRTIRQRDGPRLRLPTGTLVPIIIASRSEGTPSRPGRPAHPPAGTFGSRCHGTSGARQSRTVPSRLAEARTVPPGEKATA
jgi:hypothetical protein